MDQAERSPHRIAPCARRAAYRPDIDGLRAIAVVAVLLFHLDIGIVPGGYVGVDIFFVISGFLIGRGVATDLAAGRFSLATFYVQRIKRIFPALFAMLGAVVVTGWFLLLPGDYRNLGSSALATTLFAGNVFFARETGYFGISAAETPLLHTWSLAVEEQYYIAFPLLMMALCRWRGGRRQGVVLAILAVAFFVASVVAVRTAPTAAFYFTAFRAWEFLAGALLAVGALPDFRTKVQSSTAGVAALAILIWPIIGFTATTEFPGANALYPVIGAMLLIHSGGPASIVSRLLATPLPVFVGRISYSLYLWHWPLIVCWKYRHGSTLQSLDQIGIAAVSVVVAFLSWRFVEQPIRRMNDVRAGKVFQTALATLVLGCAVGLLVRATGGFPSRMEPQVVALDAATRSMARLPRHCTGSAPARRHTLCPVGARRDTPPTFLLWGDSHANALMPAFDRAGVELGLVGRIASYPACPALLGVDRLDQPPSHDCSAFNDAVLGELRTMPSVRTVFLVSRWGFCATGVRTEGGPPCHLGPDHELSGPLVSTQSLFTESLRRTVATLTGMGRTVVLVAPTPEFHSNVPETLARAALFGAPPDLALSERDYVRRQRPVLREFILLRDRFAVRLIYPHRILCRGGDCKTTVQGTPLYADDDHLSRTGSLLLTDVIHDALKASMQTPAIPPRRTTTHRSGIIRS
jgi:peptidoglycan/LPS O-acetylase OafA/YrhL